jgi:hypothetical protein
MTFNKLSLCLAMSFCVAVPALAEIDLFGSWAAINDDDSMERSAGPNPADWAGLPFNEVGRAKALSYEQRSSPCRSASAGSKPSGTSRPGRSASECGRAGPSHGPGSGVDHRRMGNPRAHDPMDGWASASPQRRSARSDRSYVLTRSYNLSTNPVAIGARPASGAMKASRRVGFRTTFRERILSSMK